MVIKSLHLPLLCRKVSDSNGNALKSFAPLDTIYVSSTIASSSNEYVFEATGGAVFEGTTATGS